jgi:hypothetical protein
MHPLFGTGIYAPFQKLVALKAANCAEETSAYKFDKTGKVLNQIVSIEYRDR